MTAEVRVYIIDDNFLDEFVGTFVIGTRAREELDRLKNRKDEFLMVITPAVLFALKDAAEDYRKALAD